MFYQVIWTHHMKPVMFVTRHNALIIREESPMWHAIHAMFDGTVVG